MNIVEHFVQRRIVCVLGTIKPGADIPTIIDTVRVRTKVSFYVILSIALIFVF